MDEEQTEILKRKKTIFENLGFIKAKLRLNAIDNDADRTNVLINIHVTPKHRYQ